MEDGNQSNSFIHEREKAIWQAGWVGSSQGEKKKRVKTM